MICTRCDGTGFLNLHQIPEDILRKAEDTGPFFHHMILLWISNHPDFDVSICDCCGNTKDWYGEPGEHSTADNGPNGPYAYNGGLPECW